MTDLWESSVVIAMRDWQWLGGLASSVFPDQYLSLGGNAEAADGDAILLVGEKLFLFEIKSLFSKVSDEWYGREKPKLAFDKLTKEYLAHIGQSSSYSSGSRLRQSLRCHHFAFWEAERRVERTVAGNVAVCPYILGVARKLTVCNSQGVLGAKELGVIQAALIPFALVRSTESTESGEGWEEVETVPLDVMAIPSRTNVSHLGISGYINEFEPLGLDVNEFSDYVKWLGGGVDHPIDAVVMSSKGKFFRHVRSMAELSSIFEVPRLRCQDKPDGVGHDVGSKSELRS
ncbi:hypothetical protein FEO90_06175 [Stenotrophomonas maltophilia]|nr:hypothetical protein FEO90_06175 [Stenotrophomonas maltophilia]